MAVRNCAEIGENLQLIMNRLLANDRLVKLLYYEDKDPLAKNNLTDAEKKSKIFNELIKIVPFVSTREDAKSIISIRVDDGVKNGGNSEYRDIGIIIEVFVPWTSWIIKDTNLRPFAILGAIQEALDGKTINGLGKMSGGDFQYKFGTEEISCYAAMYSITSYA